MNRTSTLVVISAPSGCGKDTIIERVQRRLSGIGVSVSCTTREPRPKKEGGYEQDGVDYFFIGRSEFEERIRQDGFLEYANVKGDLYGTPRAYVEKLRDEGNNDIIILNIENQGAAQIKAIDPNVVTVFILPPSAQELRRRLIDRGSETPERVEKRIVKGKEQMQMAYFYDYVVMNGDLDAAVEDVVHIISAVRRRTMLHKELIDRVYATYAEE